MATGVNFIPLRRQASAAAVAIGPGIPFTITLISRSSFAAENNWIGDRGIVLNDRLVWETRNALASKRDKVRINSFEVNAFIIVIDHASQRFSVMLKKNRSSLVGIRIEEDFGRK